MVECSRCGRHTLNSSLLCTPCLERADASRAKSKQHAIRKAKALRKRKRKGGRWY